MAAGQNVFFHVSSVHSEKELTLKAGDVISFVFDEFGKGAMDVRLGHRSVDAPSTSGMTPGFGPASEREESHQWDEMLDYRSEYETHMEDLRRSFRETRLDSQKINQETQEVIRD